MDIKKISANNEKKVRGLFESFASKFTKGGTIIFVIAMFCIFELVSYFILDWHVQLFLYHIMFTIFLGNFCIMWYNHAIRHAKKGKPRQVIEDEEEEEALSEYDEENEEDKEDDDDDDPVISDEEIAEFKKELDKSKK